MEIDKTEDENGIQVAHDKNALVEADSDVSVVREPDGEFKPLSPDVTAECISGSDNVPITTSVASEKVWVLPSGEIHLNRDRGSLLAVHSEVYYQKSDPPVLWAARCFENINSSEPVVTYFDDQPLELRTRNVKALNTSHKTEPPAGSNSECIPSWRGPVIKVEVSAEALFQWKMKAGEESMVPKDPSSLEIRKISRLSIIVHSSLVYRVLDRLVGYYPSFRRCPPIIQSPPNDPGFPEMLHYSFPIHEPFAVLMHYFSDIEEFVNTNTDEESALLNGTSGKRHDKEILQLEKSHMRHVYERLRPLHAANLLRLEPFISEPSPQASFDMLWYIFRPGTDVYVCLEGAIQPCVVSSVRSNIDSDYESGVTRPPWPELRDWRLDLWYLDTDGSRIGQKSTSCIIRAYSGLRELTKLSVCPATIWDASDGGMRRQKILKRSMIHVKALKQGYLLAQYTGPAKNGSHYSGCSVVMDHRRGSVRMQNPPSSTLFRQVKDYSGHFQGYNNICINNQKKTDDSAWFSKSKYEGFEPYPFEEMFPILPPPTPPTPPPPTPPTPPPPNPPKPPKKIITEPAIRRSPPSKPLYYYRPPPSNTYASPPFAFEPMSTHVNPSQPLDTEMSYVSDSVQSKLSDHQLLLLCHTTWCFAPKTKQWLTIYTDYISETSPSEESIQNLVIGENELKTIRALSNRQSSDNETWAADFIDGKGLGQIILLHGPPGVGKTYTVEAIAEWLHRPLLPLTVADIGTAETRIEGELIKWFSLAEAWNAILLVDEADIFLERRQNRDLARNGLVSAFLRRMEYFRGLLFLTTNRVGQIDDAFVSRIHVAIGYKPLTSESRKRIWNGFFKKLVKERAGKIQIAADAKKWVLERAETREVVSNGRDIRNALQTAIALAESECGEDPDFDSSKETIIVLKSHFQRVLEITDKFHEYIASIRREDEKKRAAGRGDRNDYEDGNLSTTQLR